MLVMRREQMEAFRASARRAFEDRMAVHLAATAPTLFQCVAAAPFRALVAQGMAGAAACGFDQRGPVRLYLELMLRFGSRFDTDPQYPWAAAVLADRGAGSQMDRADRLYAHASAYLRTVAGPGNTYAHRALKHLRAWAASPPPLPADGLVPALLAEVTVIYPEKADFVGPEALTILLQRATEGARNQRFRSPRSIALVAALMLALGHGCGADPLYPWIAATLRDQALTDPEVRAAHLEERALAWLDRVLAGVS